MWKSFEYIGLRTSEKVLWKKIKLEKNVADLNGLHSPALAEIAGEHEKGWKTVSFNSELSQMRLGAHTHKWPAVAFYEIVFVFEKKPTQYWAISHHRRDAHCVVVKCINMSSVFYIFIDFYVHLIYCNFSCRLRCSMYVCIRYMLSDMISIWFDYCHFILLFFVLLHLVLCILYFIT